MMCARLWCASRKLFVGFLPKLSRQLARCLRFRRLRQHLKRLREHRRLEVQLRGVVAHRLQRLVQRIIVKFLVPRRVVLVPGVHDELLGQVVLPDVDFGRAHQVHVPLVVVQGLQARESNRKEHLAQESQISGLVKDLFADTLKTHCTR